MSKSRWLPVTAVFALPGAAASRQAYNGVDVLVVQREVTWQRTACAWLTALAMAALAVLGLWALGG